MKELESLWRIKSDSELAEAGSHMEDYTSEAQRVIQSELRRRNISPVATVDSTVSAGKAALQGDTTPVDFANSENGANPVECPRCEVRLNFAGTRKFHEGKNWGILGELGELFVNKESYDVYVCPRCGKVEFFVDGIGEEFRPH